ncbi:MAG: prepilin-type N-terminal cleavage/methylation domain-containing protein, partial [Verrucomicrobiota bacterium]
KSPRPHSLTAYRKPGRVTRDGFTVLELLVSMAVLTLLLLLVMQLINSTSILTGNSNKRMAADSQARLLLDRMAQDFGKIVKRTDVDYFFQTNAGNDQMAFYSETTGYYPSGVTGNTPKSGVSLVGYRVNSNFQLERLSKSLVWNGVTGSTTGAGGLTTSDIAMVFLPKTLTASWPKIADGSDDNYQVIADQVFRLEFQFLLKSYTDPTGGTQPATLSLVPWDTRRSHTAPNGLGDVSAIVVTLALLDTTSRKVVQASQYPGMISALPDAGGTTSALQAWTDSGYLTASNIPPQAAAQIRLYQRYFYLSPSS